MSIIDIIKFISEKVKYYLSIGDTEIDTEKRELIEDIRKKLIEIENAKIDKIDLTFLEEAKESLDCIDL